MVTYLASPKGFTGIAKEHQYRAIRSWLGDVKGAEVILYGDAPGTQEAGRELHVDVVADIPCAASGIPYLNAIVADAAERGRYDLQVFVNCDIILSGLARALSAIRLSRFLLIGQRVDIGEDIAVDVSESDWLSRISSLGATGQATLHSPTGADYFGFRRGTLGGLPAVVIGRAGYDNAFIAHCMRSRIPIVDATLQVAALHQFHEYGHVQGGRRAVMLGADAQANIELAGGPRSATLVSDAELVLQRGALVRWPCRGDALRRLELRLRYEADLPSVALALRLLWRALATVRVTRIQQLQLEEVLSGWRASLPT